MSAQEAVARDAAELITRTTKAQGLPERITDLTTLRKVATIVASSSDVATGARDVVVPGHGTTPAAVAGVALDVSSAGGHEGGPCV